MKRREQKAVRVVKKILIYVLLVFITGVTIYPIVQIFGISLRPADQLYSTSLRIIPENASFDAYRKVIFEKDFFTWLRNSAIVALAVSILGVSLASTAGYAFSRFRFGGKKAGLVAILLTQMFPATMLLLPLYVLMKNLGLVDTLLGIIIAYTATALPFCIWTMKGYYDTIPRDLEEAAVIDGTTQFGAFLRVTLPLSAPALVITALFSFMAGWSEFIVARVIINRQALYTLPLGLESLSSTFQTEWANYAAGSILVCIPVVALFLLLSRFLISGLTLGGVKG
ncbi:MAG TPA: sugar ABC transporter permease [Patescibacteria group bacterium]|nr:sugar ABC transporter permease [Patescibacteria group bacterium]